MTGIPAVRLLFDVIPPWFSRRTLRGHRLTPHYTAPLMPWGVRRDDLAPLLHGWTDRITAVEVHSFGSPSRPVAALLPLLAALPGLRNLPPAFVRVDAR
ncbi:hypothetical protein [Nocardia seriolae]|uniref:Methyltransferase n=1 Tax=Nocardia seriolae TaxID=37332 RepID=A0A0B8NQD7_9NOCA|nr:hypothetical protein [Nocardia seriolae]APA95861.1 hypothetical protein NS506_01793 [Nocardia seriolae]MTJ66036.1 hypothetical protein [Nocardia seriolae]MTJ75437.1 hypothetical protein [Nocardia seriolae]MTJ86043.1 hypothetical protein [Nocardia seriolae]MTK30038.1 hypothetical protein [Nocardia seriolae]